MQKKVEKDSKQSRLLHNVRTFLPPMILVVAAVGFAFHAGFGTLSDFGWMDISILCPLGALTTMLSSKMLVPRAVISLIVVVVLVILLGRAFCGWICPVPFVAKLRQAFTRRAGSDAEPADKNEQADAAVPAKEAVGEGAVASPTVAPLSEKEKALLKGSYAGSCAERRKSLDSRHVVAGGALLSAVVFGFPVFCLICPIGLSFATVLLLVRAFGMGDVTIALVVVPVILLVEVVFFRKWCHTFCPLGAIMSLIGKANRTLKPAIDDSKCLEASKQRKCGACARVCPEGIDPRHPERGWAQMNECTRCRKCADACPAGAITFPLVPSDDVAERSKDEIESAAN